MNTKLKFVISLLLAFPFTQIVFTQEIPNPSEPLKWEVGLFLGVSSLQGDLSSPDKLPNIRPAYGAFGQYHFTTNWSVKIGLTQSTLQDNDLESDDVGRQSRGFRYENRLTELAGTVHYDLFGHKRYQTLENFKKRVSPFFFAGLGVAFGTPETFFRDRDNSEAALNDKQNTEAYRLTVPFGGGLKYDLTKKAAVSGEIGFRPTFSDLVDGVSETGNPDKNDFLLFAGLKIHYRFVSDDFDGDGITDDRDKCPRLAGSKKMKGCPDSDGDGISDLNDLCPFEVGSKTQKGCPDRDMDGVRDDADLCPDEKGMQRLNGCPDADWDNVPDHLDACPNLAGLERLKGCPEELEEAPKDSLIVEKIDEIVVDSSKISNKNEETEITNIQNQLEDNESKIADKSINDPQSDIQDIEVEDLKTEVELPDPTIIRFSTAKNQVTIKHQDNLVKVINILNDNPTLRVQIDGYADSVGNETLNQKLSEKRAYAVYQYFLTKGISRDRMTFNGYGESNPTASNATAEGRALNRRVEVRVKR